MHEIDERLEHPALFRAIVRPERPVFPVCAVAQHHPEQEMQAPRRLPERVALDVEDHVARGGSRQELEAAASLTVEAMPRKYAGRAPLELQRRLVTQRFERVRLEVGNLRRAPRRTSGARRRAVADCTWTGAGDEARLSSARFRSCRCRGTRTPTGPTGRLGREARTRSASAPVVRREIVVTKHAFAARDTCMCSGNTLTAAIPSL
jgi:hypothetical protein